MSAETGASKALSSAKGCPGSCRCTPYRFMDAQKMDRDRKHDAMLEPIMDGTPVGILAFESNEPVGWCFIARRATCEKLLRSQFVPVVDAEAWLILCVGVRPSRRGQGITRVLAEGGLRYARGNGASVVEAYPWDTAGLSGTGPAKHWGHSKAHASTGFHREGKTRRCVGRVDADACASVKYEA